jgi:hypothetical protein
MVTAGQPGDVEHPPRAAGANQRRGRIADQVRGAVVQRPGQLSSTIDEVNPSGERGVELRRSQLGKGAGEGHAITSAGERKATREERARPPSRATCWWVAAGAWT